MPEHSRRRSCWKQQWALLTNAVREWVQPTEQTSRRTSASLVGSASVWAGRLERYREDDCSPCAKMTYMTEVCQTSSTMGSKGIRSNISRGIKIRPYFDIHLNWHCHQSPSVLHPGFIHLQAPSSDASCTLQAQISMYPWKESQRGLSKWRFTVIQSSWLFTFPSRRVIWASSQTPSRGSDTVAVVNSQAAGRQSLLSTAAVPA